MIQHKRFKMHKLLSLILALALAMPLLPVTATPSFAAEAASYTDTGTHWASSAIDKWSGVGILQGYDGAFRPDKPITRGEMAVIIDRIMNYQTAAKNDFSDLGQAFYTNAVLKANAAGVILGYDGKFHPMDNISREDVAVMLGRALRIEESTEALSFADAGLVSSYAKGYVAALAQKGYVNGYNGSFNPKNPITRAEVVTILNNAIAGFVSEAKEYTGTYTGIVVVNKSGATVKDAVINGGLIIADGVGNGDVTLENVKVTGNTIVRGGGENSIHIKGGSYAGLIIEKTDEGKVRIVTSDGAAVDAVYVDDGNDDVILSGSFGIVTMKADVNLVIDSGSNVATLTVAASGVTVTNNGSIAKLDANADGVVVGGNKPSEVNAGSGVTKPPVDKSGNPLKGGSTSTTGGSGHNGGGSGDDSGANAEAQIGSTYYATFGAAITAAQTNGGADTITLLKSIAIATTASIRANDTLVIPNGVTLTDSNSSLIGETGATLMVQNGGSFVLVPWEPYGTFSAGPYNYKINSDGDRWSAAQARISDKYFADLDAAIAAANANTAQDEIYVIGNDTSPAYVSGNITFGAAASGSDILTVPTGGSIQIGNFYSPSATLSQAGGTLINKGDIGGNAFTASGGTIDVSGIFDVSVLNVGGALKTWHSGATIIIDNGSAITGVTNFSATVDGSYRYDGTSWAAAPAYVEHNHRTTYYTSFEDALAAAEAGDVVGLLLSYTVEAGSELTVPASITLTIDTDGSLKIKSGGSLTVNGELYLVNANTGLVIESGGEIGGAGTIEVTDNTLNLMDAVQSWSVGATIIAANSGTHVVGLNGSTDAENGIFIYYDNRTEKAWVAAKASVFNNNTSAIYYATLAEALAAAHGNGAADYIGMRGTVTLTENAQVDAADSLILSYSLTVSTDAALNVDGTLDFQNSNYLTVNGTLAFGANSECSNLANYKRITVGASGSVTGITDSNGAAFIAGSTYRYNSSSGWVKQ